VTADRPPASGDFSRWFGGAVTTVQLACRSIGSVPVTIHRFRLPSVPPAGPLPQLVVEFVLDRPLAARMDFGYGRFEATVRPGSFVVLPPDRPIAVESAARDVSLLTLAIPAEHLRRPNGAGRYAPELLHGRVHADPLAAQIAHRLWDEAEAGNPWGDLFADHAVAALAALLGRLADPTDRPPPAPRRLSAARHAAVVEYVADNLDRPIRLSDLAAVARQSQFHFARQFKAATGQTPYQFVIGERIERARALLAAGRLTLAEVAAAVGFTDQSQFTRHFKRLVGVTPKRFG
jgi:AraC family transcriptional regulator